MDDQLFSIIILNCLGYRHKVSSYSNEDCYLFGAGRVRSPGELSPLPVWRRLTLMSRYVSNPQVKVNIWLVVLSDQEDYQGGKHKHMLCNIVEYGYFLSQLLLNPSQGMSGNSVVKALTWQLCGFDSSHVYTLCLQSDSKCLHTFIDLFILLHCYTCFHCFRMGTELGLSSG